MAIVLPERHPRASQLDSRDPGDSTASRVRIGIINIMPKLEAYEVSLLEPLAEHAELVEPVFIRLRSHGYQSSDHAHLDQLYRPFDEVIAEAPLDGLILTGAPVEELAYEDVHYFRELEAILRYARVGIAVTLGLCWGGMALAKLVGIEKRAFRRKLFGVFEDDVLVAGHDLVSGAAFPCAHSRHSGLREEEVERATLAGTIRPLSRGELSGTTLFETCDRRFVGHLGHPEYSGERIAFEWERDRNLGRTDVYPPANFDPAAPSTPWRAHRRALFGGVIRRAAHGTAAERRHDGAVIAAAPRSREATAPIQYCP